MEFSKYHGAGNDFIIVDGIREPIHLTEKQLAYLCDRRFGIGADGLIIIRKHTSFDFEMVYYNSDGKPGSMCGNGARCIVKFAFNKSYIHEGSRFLAADGAHEAKVLPEGLISVHMKDVTEIETQENAYFLNTGSPHYIKFVDQLASFNVFLEGRLIRNSPPFKEQGTNVNFLEWQGKSLFVRTYERGVEDETLSCGTGVTAAALVAGSLKSKKIENSIDVITKGGKLTVNYTREEAGFSNIWLEGPAVHVYTGKIII